MGNRDVWGQVAAWATPRAAAPLLFRVLEAWPSSREASGFPLALGSQITGAWFSAMLPGAAPFSPSGSTPTPTNRPRFGSTMEPLRRRGPPTHPCPSPARGQASVKRLTTPGWDQREDGRLGSLSLPSGPGRCQQLAWCSSQLPAMASGLPSTAGLARFCQKLKRLKPLEEATMETSLQRCLSALDLTLLGVGAMVGSGLYVLTGTVAKEITGPAVIVSFTVAAVASLLAALCYAEFGARVPRTGSAYLFTYVSMGELWAFLIGWNLVLEYVIAGAAVARAWSGYLDAMFDHHIRNFTEAHVGIWQVPLLARYPDFLAAGILLLASTFVSCGARVSSWLNHTLSAISMVVILFIIILGFVLARSHNWGKEEGGFAPFGFSGIMSGTATCFYAFVGFDVIAASSEEARNPKRAVPLAIAISLGLAASAYILVSTVLTLMVPWHSLDPNSALADAFYQRGYSWAGYLVATGSICGKWGPALASRGTHLQLGLSFTSCIMDPGTGYLLDSTQACWQRPTQPTPCCTWYVGLGVCFCVLSWTEVLSLHQIPQWPVT